MSSTKPAQPGAETTSVTAGQSEVEQVFKARLDGVWTELIGQYDIVPKSAAPASVTVSDLSEEEIDLFVAKFLVDNQKFLAQFLVDNPAFLVNVLKANNTTRTCHYRDDGAYVISNVINIAPEDKKLVLEDIDRLSPQKEDSNQDTKAKQAPRSPPSTGKTVHQFGGKSPTAYAQTPQTPKPKSMREYYGGKYVPGYHTPPKPGIFSQKTLPGKSVPPNDTKVPSLTSSYVVDNEEDEDEKSDNDSDGNDNTRDGEDTDSQEEDEDQSDEENDDSDEDSTYEDDGSDHETGTVYVRQGLDDDECDVPEPSVEAPPTVPSASQLSSSTVQSSDDGASKTRQLTIQEEIARPYPADPADIAASRLGPETRNWRLFEQDDAIRHMLEINEEGEIKGENRFKEIAIRLAKDGIKRTHTAVKNFWNRIGRARSGFDERKNKKAPLSTSHQVKSKDESGSNKSKKKSGKKRKHSTRHGHDKKSKPKASEVSDASSDEFDGNTSSDEEIQVIHRGKLVRRRDFLLKVKKSLEEGEIDEKPAKKRKRVIDNDDDSDDETSATENIKKKQKSAAANEQNKIFSDIYGDPRRKKNQQASSKGVEKTKPSSPNSHNLSNHQIRALQSGLRLPPKPGMYRERK